MTVSRIMTLAVDSSVDEVDGTSLKDLIPDTFPGIAVVNDEHVEDVSISEIDATEPNIDGITLPLSLDVARALADEDNYITVVLEVDQNDFMEAVVTSRQTGGMDDEGDLVHDKAFAFGTAFNYELKIIGVVGYDFIVSYTTDLSEAIREAEDEETSAA